ncbi:MAG TPA: PCRF domain-containing protein, partial [Gammaproteobacteria bacterium]
MKPSIRSKLETLSERLQELSALLAEPDVVSNQERYRALSMEYAQLEPVVKCFNDYRKTLDDLATAEEMLGEGDAELKAMAEEEMKSAKQRLEVQELELQKLLLPKDPNDNKNIFLEVRAGTG